MRQKYIKMLKKYRVKVTKPLMGKWRSEEGHHLQVKAKHPKVMDDTHDCLDHVGTSASSSYIQLKRHACTSKQVVVVLYN